MADPNYAPIGEEPSDDLPRTFRREKEAREREARERAARERAAAPSLSMGSDEFTTPPPKVFSDRPAAAASSSATIDSPIPAVVHRFDVPFAHLATFFLKAIVAAIPALILLMAILFGLGKVLGTFFPDLVKMKILIGFGG